MTSFQVATQVIEHYYSLALCSCIGWNAHTIHMNAQTAMSCDNNFLEMLSLHILSSTEWSVPLS